MFPDELAREDLKYYNRLKQEGWTPEYSAKDQTHLRFIEKGEIPHYTLGYSKDTTKVWHSGNYIRIHLYWGRLENGKFSAHKTLLGAIYNRNLDESIQN